jgi:hypothetical protein
MIGKASTISANWKSGVKVEGGFQDYVALNLKLSPGGKFCRFEG